MDTTPMTFKVEISSRDWYHHPLRKEWNSIPHSHPIYGDGESLTLFLKQEYNINIFNIYHDDNEDIVIFEFKSEQDYTLWILHQ